MNLPPSSQIPAMHSLHPNWDPFHAASIETLVRNPPRHEHPSPYAVFDWDNTSIFLDIQEAVLFHQLTTFDLTHHIFPDILRLALPTEVPLHPSCTNLHREHITLDALLADIEDLHARLCSSATPLQERDLLHDFRVKVLFLYQSLTKSYSDKVAYLWIARMFTGFSQEEAKNLTHQAIHAEQQRHIHTQSYATSDLTASGQTGPVRISWRHGMRTSPEMQSLYAFLMAHDIDVFVCSASGQQAVSTFATSPQYHYNVPPTHVFATTFSYTQEEGYLDSLLPGSVQTQSEGKTQTITTHIASVRGHGPLLVAGDSHGDHHMLTSFPDTKIQLLIDRNKPEPIASLCRQANLSYGKTHARTLLQKRDETTGAFIHST